ncbi:unnamed protein product [Rotaria sp. Silwood1]|nr:unnamed protein product [Rotaria sp. Silwood1]
MNLSKYLCARSEIESTNGINESFLPLISTGNGNSDSHKPYRRNDFANNHLFIAKRKLARVFLGQPSRSLQATSDLIHLFDQQKPKRKNRNVNDQQRQKSLRNIFGDEHARVSLIILPCGAGKSLADVTIACTIHKNYFILCNSNVSV